MLAIKKNLNNVTRTLKFEENRLEKLRLDMNEFVGDIPQRAVQEALAGIDGDFLSTYPEYTGLYRRLGAKFSLPDGHLLLTNGSDSASKLIFDTFVSSGDKVLITNATYAMHKVYGKISGATFEEVSYNSDFSFPLQACLDQIKPDIKLLILVNPVNPYGTLISEEELLKIARKTKETGTLFFLDEAYIEFSGRSFAPHIRDFNHLVITRTFSKAYGLSAVRLGYAIAQPEIIQSLRLTQPTFDVNRFAVRFAEYFLDHPQILEDSLQQLKEGEAFVTSQLSELGLPYHAGSANFILIKIGEKLDAVVNALKEHGILVSSNLGLPALEGYMRITVGNRDKMLIFIHALKKVIR